jgi:hypothetical protein
MGVIRGTFPKTNLFLLLLFSISFRFRYYSRTQIFRGLCVEFTGFDKWCGRASSIVKQVCGNF